MGVSAAFMGRVGCIPIIILTTLIFPPCVHSLLNIPKASKHLHSNNTECSEFHHLNKSDVCYFIKVTTDCQFEDGFLQYLQLPYCAFRSSETFVGFILLGCWLMYLFLALGITAEEFFCPCLQTIARTLHMSDSVAGVTLLALGNGAPDIFSVIAAINSPDKDTAPMAFQELFGAGMFVTTVVAGSIQLRVSFQFARRPFLRDLLFYITAVGWTFAVMYRKEIETAEAIGFIVLYCIYVAFVIIGQAVNRSLRQRSLLTNGAAVPVVLVNDAISDLSASAGFTAVEPQHERSSLIRHSFTGHSYASVNQDGAQGWSHDGAIYREPNFIGRLVGLNADKWESKACFWKIFDLIKIPIELCLNITTPVVDQKVQGQMWNKWLVMLQCVISPVLCAFLTRNATVRVGHQIVLWQVLLIIGSALCIIVFVLTSKSHSPKFHFIFAFLGFAVSVIWIYTIAHEIVNLLQAFGIAFGLSYAIMGLTLLAWGNSIGDFVSNLTMARHGAPRMAIAACFGGPLLNMMLGVGIACTVSAVSNHGQLRLIRGHVQYIISASFLAVSLVSSLILMPIFKFKSAKFVGVYLLTLYIAYITISVLNEVGVLF